ncbi:MAG: hypothetical protein LBJ42_01420, partial [Holosporales bacterium]|nr:hypothetical protein [Holosporales bacterium]
MNLHKMALLATAISMFAGQTHASRRGPEDPEPVRVPDTQQTPSKPKAQPPAPGKSPAPVAAGLFALPAAPGKPSAAPKPT